MEQIDQCAVVILEI